MTSTEGRPCVPLALGRRFDGETTPDAPMARHSRPKGKKEP